MVVRMQDEHELTDRLLPWFVNGTLAPDEHERVQRHVDCCEACREEVTVLAAIRSSVRHDDATPIVLPPRAETLFEAIDAAAGRSRRRRVLAASLLAASVAAVMLVGTLLPVYRERGSAAPVLYETTTSPTQPASMDYVFDLQFEPGTPPAEQRRTLEGLEASDVERLEEESKYRVTINLSIGSLQELEQYTDGISALPDVQSINVVALQLPVKRKQ